MGTTDKEESTNNSKTTEFTESKKRNKRRISENRMEVSHEVKLYRRMCMVIK